MGLGFFCFDGATFTWQAEEIVQTMILTRR
jgi:hypothetical protein